MSPKLLEHVMTFNLNGHRRAFLADEELKAEARGEIRMLKTPGKRGVLAEKDPVSKKHVELLERMLAE